VHNTQLTRHDHLTCSRVRMHANDTQNLAAASDDLLAGLSDKPVPIMVQRSESMNKRLDQLADPNYLADNGIEPIQKIRSNTFNIKADENSGKIVVVDADEVDENDVSNQIPIELDGDGLPKQKIVLQKGRTMSSMNWDDLENSSSPLKLGTSSNTITNPSPISRNDFRKRRLTFAKKGKSIGKRKKALKTKVFSSGEIGADPSDHPPPFPVEILGTFSCHGIEPAYDEVDRSDIVVSKINQDRGCVAYPYGGSKTQALFAAYDGHGEVGELVSEFTMQEVQSRLENHETFESDIKKAFEETFVGVDEDLATDDDIDAEHSGTTAIAVLMRDKTFHVACAGDSRAVIAKKSTDGVYRAENLSVDQNPNLPSEQERIEKAGGFVSPPPGEGLSARVWLDKDFTQIGLAMGRSIGDHAVKHVGVIALPEVTEYEIAEEDEFLILASDGVWEFIDSDEAVDIVSRYFYKYGATKACEILIENAAERWRDEEGDYRDDITAIVVGVKQLGW